MGKISRQHPIASSFKKTGFWLAVLGLVITTLIPTSAQAQNVAKDHFSGGQRPYQAAVTVTPTGPLDNIQTVTRQPDGSIIHEVQPGQSLWSIAIVYNVKIEDIQKANQMGSSEIVRPGDKLIIAPAYTPTPTATITNTSLPPTRTLRPTRTPRPPTLTPNATQGAESAAVQVTPTPQPAKPLLPLFEPGASPRRMLGIGMIVICGLGLLIVLIGGVKKN